MRLPLALKMKTYHYTSYSNWQKIKKEGMIPYKIKNYGLKEIGMTDVVGIWLWTHKLKGVSHAGSILYQLAQKCDTKVVLLELQINRINILDFIHLSKKTKKNLVKAGVAKKDDEFGNVMLYHKGHIENWWYHTKEEAFIYIKPIPPKDMKLVQTYDVVKLLK